MRVHLLDGTYELFRMFYGLPENERSKPGAAARALLRNVETLRKRQDVSHIGVAFDHVIESFRNELFPGYKTGEGIDPVLEAQFHLAEELLQDAGIVVWPMVEMEADDGLATAAAVLRGIEAVQQVVIGSPDKDLLQCVRGQRVVCWDRKKDVYLDEIGVMAKMGVAPKSIPDYLALVGDNADGIPGIPRWGAKSAAAVLQHYETLEAIPDDHASWGVKVRGGEALAQELRSRRADAILYRTLATLREDAPIQVALDALSVRL